MSLFSRLFARTPKYHESAYGPFYAAVVSRLERTGVRVGKTAGYPRVEVHSITEGERLDKEGQLRQLSFTVESIGNASLAATTQTNEDNVRLLTSEGFELPEGWRLVGIVPDQLQDLSETSDTAKIIYRLLQGFNAWVERVKAEPEPPTPEDPIPEDPTPAEPAVPDEPESPAQEDEEQDNQQ